MIGVFPLLYVIWKVVHKTKIHKPEEVDLQKGLAEIEEYERNFVPTKANTMFERVLDKVFG
jgi:amino acid transporter